MAERGDGETEEQRATRDGDGNKSLNNKAFRRLKSLQDSLKVLMLLLTTEPGAVYTWPRECK